MRVLVVFILLSVVNLNAQTKQNTASKPKKSGAEKVVVQVDSKAEYIGGQDKMIDFVVANLKFPESMKADTSFKGGKVFLKFKIDPTGAVTNVEVTKGVKGCKDCDKEAVRVIQMMPKWKPAIENNIAVESWYQLPIGFKKEDQ